MQTFIHADDFPEMQGYVGGDGSHVGSEHITEFTKVLTEILIGSTGKLISTFESIGISASCPLG